MSDRDDSRRPPSPEESEAATRLAVDLERGESRGGELPTEISEEAELAHALRAAWAPGELPEADLTAIVDEALDEEVAAARALRDALDTPSAANDDAAFARALRAAWAPTPLPDDEHEALLARSLAPTAPAGQVVPLAPRRRVVAAIGAITGALALAATLLLFVRTTPTDEEVALARTRSTQPLFAEPFKAGQTSARIDRIATARAADYRDNRFATWGVR